MEALKSLVLDLAGSAEARALQRWTGDSLSLLSSFRAAYICVCAQPPGSRCDRRCRERLRPASQGREDVAMSLSVLGSSDLVQAPSSSIHSLRQAF